MSDHTKIEWTEATWNPVTGSDVPFFFKQLGSVLARQLGVPGKGVDLADIPDNLRIRQVPA